MWKRHNEGVAEGYSSCMHDFRWYSVSFTDLYQFLFLIMINHVINIIFSTILCLIMKVVIVVCRSSGNNIVEQLLEMIKYLFRNEKILDVHTESSLNLDPTQNSNSKQKTLFGKR